MERDCTRESSSSKRVGVVVEGGGGGVDIVVGGFGGCWVLVSWGRLFDGFEAKQERSVRILDGS